VAIEHKLESAFATVLPEEGLATFLSVTVSDAFADSWRLFTLPERALYDRLTQASKGLAALVLRARTWFAVRALPFDHYVRNLHDSIRQEPVLDGINHAGQSILSEAFGRESAAADRWILALVQDPTQASFAADVLRLLCRFKPRSAGWRRTIVETALRSPSLEVRDAAIQAVESWADRELVGVLRGHAEPDRFLCDYAAQVVRDLDEG
jgi:hypothetical protein